MYKILYFFFFFTVLCLASCTDSTTDYVAERNNMVATIDIPFGLNNLETHYFRINNVDLLFTETMSANGLKLDPKYKVSGAKGRLLSRLGQLDFATFSKVRIYAVSPDDENVRREIYYQENIPFTQSTELKLLTSLSNIRDVMNDKDEIHLDIAINFRGISAIDSKVDFEFGYVVVEE